MGRTTEDFLGWGAYCRPSVMEVTLGGGDDMGLPPANIEAGAAAAGLRTPDTDTAVVATAVGKDEEDTGGAGVGGIPACCVA